MHFHAGCGDGDNVSPDSKGLLVYLQGIYGELGTHGNELNLCRVIVS